jgi:tight adherence protein B
MNLSLELAAIGALFGSGLALVALGLRPATRNQESTRSNRFRLPVITLKPVHALSLLAGLGALVVTKWPMAVPLGAAAVLGLEGLGGKPSRTSIARLEAVAIWTEMLRDTLAGAAGLSQALIATAGTVPGEIAQPIGRLASQLSAGVSAESAIRELADALEDPAGDMIAAALLLATRERAQKLGDLLSALARSTREEVTMRLRIEASRASSRTAVRMVTGFSLALFALMAVFARSYLSPYHSALGQVVLGLVGILFGLGLWLMASMIRPKPLPRLGLAGVADK